MNEQADTNRDLLYDLIMRIIDVYMKAPGSQDVHPLILTLADTFGKLVEIDESPKGQELKRKIITLLGPDTHLIEILQSLAKVANIPSVALYVKTNWLVNDFPLFRIEAIKFLVVYYCDSNYLVNLLKDEKDSSVQLAIVTEISKVENHDVQNCIFDFIKKAGNDEICLVALSYFENFIALGGYLHLLEIAYNTDNIFSKTVEDAAFAVLKRVVPPILREND